MEILLLSLIVFLPALSTLVLAFLPKDQPDMTRWFTLGVTVVVFLLAVAAFFIFDATEFDAGMAQMQDVFNVPWIPTFDIEYFMGIDGISFPLVMLTVFITMLSMAASWSITRHVKAYCILFLLLLTGMIGVFMALDFFLFYVFWEVMLLPMYFLIGVWGGPRKEYAALKFFLYTLLGSVLMLIAILMLYFSSDLTQLSPQQLAESRVLDTILREEIGTTPGQANEYQVTQAATLLREQIEAGQRSPHTFNLLALAQLGQHTDVFDARIAGMSIQWWAFLLLFIGFAIKVPAVPLHTWLPDAHVEAPTPISMILAGILLKMGGYGIIRICYPICPAGGYELRWFVCLVGVVSLVYGAFAALAQKDFKRLVAYSSVSHMGYVVLGFGVWSAAAGTMYNSDYWAMGISGAMFQMIAHGISSAGMFFMVGVLYDRVHHRNLDQFGGIFGKMPLYSGLSIGIFFAALGLPGLCGFVGEVFVVLATWKFDTTLAVIAASVVVLTAGYILWTLQRVYLGAEYRGPHEEALKPMTSREGAIAVPLFVLAILFGILPYHTVLRYMEGTIEHQANQLAAWTQREVPVPVVAETVAADSTTGEQPTLVEPRQDSSAAAGETALPADSTAALAIPTATTSTISSLER